MYSLYLLGGLRLHHTQELGGSKEPGSNVDISVRFHTRKVALLLAYLVLNSSPQPRKELARLFWPEMSDVDQNNSLRVALWALRKQLDSIGLDSKQVLSTSRLMVHLRESDLACDVEQFQAHWKASLDLMGGPRIDHLQAAFDLYQGRLLAGYYEDWIEPLAISQESLFERIAHELISLHHQSGNLDSAIAVAKHASERLGPCSDFAAIAQQLTDREQLALRVSTSIAASLPPSAPNYATTSFPSGSIALPNGNVTSHRNGESVDHDISRAFDLGGIDTSKTSLPLYPTRFWGRKDELATLLETTNRNGVMRLVTLVGLPAIGKTRVCVEAARHALTKGLVDRVHFVSLASVDSPDILADTLRAALAIPTASTTTSLAQVVSSLRTECLRHPRTHVPPAQTPLDLLGESSFVGQIGGPHHREHTNDWGRRGGVVLVLDNLEHLLPEAALFVQNLRLQLPDLLIWTTSRALLQLPGEEVLEVTGLPLPDENDDLVKISESPSIQLFVQRARSVKRTFLLTSSNARALVQLCHHLEGWPLALELAASRSHSFTPVQMVQQLRSNVNFLSLPLSTTNEDNEQERAALMRQSSLQAAIDWSFRLLSPGAAQCLLALAVFRGGATAEHLEHVTREESIVPSLAELVAHSLVNCDEKRGVLRYDVLEGVRQFSRNQFDREQWNELRRNHAVTFAYFLCNAPKAMGQATRDWFEQLDAERDNLRAALEWAHENDPDLMLHLSAKQWRYWESRGFITEGIQWLSRAVLATNNGDGGNKERKQLTVAALNGLTRLHFAAGQFAQGIEAAKGAHHLALRCGDTAGLAYALLGEGIIRLYQGQVTEALGRLEQSHVLFEKQGDLSGSAHALTYLGFAGIFGGAFDISFQTYQKAVSRAREAGDDARLSMALFFCGDALGPVGGRYAEAQPYFLESHRIAQKIGDGVAASYALWGLCRVAIAQSKLDLAQTYLKQVDEFCRRTNYQWGQVFVLEAAALIAVSRHNLGQGAMLMGAAEAARERLGLPMTASYYAEFDRQLKPLWKELTLAELQQFWIVGRRHRLDQALKLARGETVTPEELEPLKELTAQPFSTSPPVGFPCHPHYALAFLAESHLGTGRLALHQGDYQMAHDHLKQAEQLYTQLGDLENIEKTKSFLQVEATKNKLD